MDEPLPLLLAAAAGMVIGALFFGGLWWTLRRALTSRWAPLWFAFSMLGRTLLAVSGFYLVSSGHWQRVPACLLGFLLARAAVTWLTRPREDAPQEATHAAQP
jgi:F1F0 ATPase subunit 2